MADPAPAQVFNRALWSALDLIVFHGVELEDAARAYDITPATLRAEMRLVVRRLADAYGAVDMSDYLANKVGRSVRASRKPAPRRRAAPAGGKGGDSLGASQLAGGGGAEPCDDRRSPSLFADLVSRVVLAGQPVEVVAPEYGLTAIQGQQIVNAYRASQAWRR